MQITEKLRKEILFALPELSMKQVEKIAAENDVSIPTVWRYWRKLRENEPLTENPVIIAIAELAVNKKKLIVARHKRLSKAEKQLSAIK